MKFIGPRIVPLVMGDYTALGGKTRSWDFYVLVTYQGGSYVSRSFVPIGVEITDTNYWVLFGDWNAQIEAYHHEVVNLSQIVDDNTDDIASIKTEQTSQNVSISALLSSVAGNTATIGDHTSQLNTLNNKVLLSDIVVVGDSYTTGFQAGQAVITKLGTRIGTKLGLNVHQYGVNASGYLLGGDTNKTFYQQLQDAVADNSYNHQRVKHVLIIGGRNDTDETITFLNQVRATIQYAHDSFVNAMVSVIPLWDRAALTKYEVFRIIYNTCNEYWWARTCNTSFQWLQGEYDRFITNDIHPNESGTEEFANYICAFLNGNNYAKTTDLVRFTRNATYVSATDVKAGVHNGNILASGGCTLAQNANNGAILGTFSGLLINRLKYIMGAGNSGASPVLLQINPTDSSGNSSLVVVNVMGQVLQSGSNVVFHFMGDYGF